MPDKRPKAEDEYFAREEQARKQQAEVVRREEARRERRELHFMKCPKCGGDLATSRFQAVDVDRCGECSGVWLDAGELEKLAGSESTLLTDFFNMLRGRS
jgi:hypothetical protein